MRDVCRAPASTGPALSNRLKTALDPRAGCPVLGVSSGREAGVSGVGRTPHLLARTLGDGSDVTQPPRASSRLRHGRSPVGSLWPASFVETGRCWGSGKGGGAPGRLLCPLCIACPGSSGLAVASSKAPGFCLVVGKSEPKPLLPVRTCEGAESRAQGVLVSLDATPRRASSCSRL